ncbi:hypothetical protein TMatcc_009986 [Talaromyces marneffei ATCC 18224]
MGLLKTEVEIAQSVTNILFYTSVSQHYTMVAGTRQSYSMSMIATINATKCKTSFSSKVNPGLGSLASFAMRPKTVLSPVETTIASALPDTQCVP